MHRDLVSDRERRPQHVVPAHDLLEDGPQDLAVQGPLQAQLHRNVVERRSGLEAVECWDGALGQEYLSFTAIDAAGAEVGSQLVGSLHDCGPIFSNSLADLNIPTLEDIDPELRSVLDDVATNGMPAD